MKTFTTITAVLLLTNLAALAQGTVTFTTVTTTILRAPVYGPEPGNILLSKTGNTSAGIPAGTQVYTGALLTGSGFTAQLWAANGAGQSESALIASPGAITTFRTGAAAGFVAFTTATLTGVPRDAPVATLQLRVWDNQGGTITSWVQAISFGIRYGKSALFEVNAIGGDFNPNPFLTGIQSFNLIEVPEPFTITLFSVSALLLWFFRRSKSAS